MKLNQGKRVQSGGKIGKPCSFIDTGSAQDDVEKTLFDKSQLIALPEVAFGDAISMWKDSFLGLYQVIRPNRSLVNRPFIGPYTENLAVYLADNPSRE